MRNIAALLRNAPNGIKLYSPFLGNVELIFVTDRSLDVSLGKEKYRFDEYGRLVGVHVADDECEYVKSIPNKGDCMLFPHELVDWEGDWGSVVFPQCVGSVIIYDGDCPYLVGVDELYTTNPSVYGDTIRMEKFDFEGVRFATSDETEKYFAALDANGWGWDNFEGCVYSTLSNLVGKWIVFKDRVSDGWRTTSNGCRVRVGEKVLCKSYSSGCFIVEDPCSGNEFQFDASLFSEMPDDGHSCGDAPDQSSDRDCLKAFDRVYVSGPEGVLLVGDGGDREYPNLFSHAKDGRYFTIDGRSWARCRPYTE